MLSSLELETLNVGNVVSVREPMMKKTEMTKLQIRMMFRFGEFAKRLFLYSLGGGEWNDTLKGDLSDSSSDRQSSSIVLLGIVDRRGFELVDVGDLKRGSEGEKERGF